MKIIRNVLIIVLVIVFQLAFLQPVNVEAISFTDIFSNAEDFLNTGKQENEGKDKNGVDKQVVNEEALKELNSGIYNILFSLGVVISVIIGAILGIQIMVGSIEQKTKAKEALMPFVIGCIIIFLSFVIWKIIANALTDITDTAYNQFIYLAKIVKIL